jgi:methyl-accepting chemotaxis protein
MAAEAILKAVTEIRTIADRNARSVEDSRRATDALRERTTALGLLATRIGKTPGRRRNGGRR